MHSCEYNSYSHFVVEEIILPWRSMAGRLLWEAGKERERVSKTKIILTNHPLIRCSLMTYFILQYHDTPSVRIKHNTKSKSNRLVSNLFFCLSQYTSTLFNVHQNLIGHYSVNECLCKCDCFLCIVLLMRSTFCVVLLRIWLHWITLDTLYIIILS